MNVSFFDEKTKRKLKLYKAIAKKWLLRSLGRYSKKRNVQFVKKEYGRVWSPESSIKNDRPHAQELEGKLVMWNSCERRKFVASYFSKALKGYGAIEHILEMGSGSGMNIVVLALLHPEIKKWWGVELTSEGVASSQALLHSPPYEYLEAITELSPQEIKDRLSRAKITFLQGDMTHLPFEGKTVDVVFSCQAIEQLPRAYRAAFSEAKRVSKKYVFFLEEFKEAQRNLFERIHLRNADYFCASYRELEALGFVDISYEEFPLRPLHYGLGFVSAAVSKAN